MIIEVDGQPTPDLDAFVAVASKKGSGETVRIKTMSLRGKVSVSTLTLDKQYWPTSDITLGLDGTWKRTTLDQEQGTGIAPKGGDGDDGVGIGEAQRRVFEGRD